MNISFRCDVIAIIVFLLLAITTQVVNAQTPAQMEYERQQREYRRQLEQQQQEQQRLQQQMNENARRQQEESRRLNAPAAQDAAPAYQGASPQGARRPATQVDVAAAIAAKDWEAAGSSLKGEHDFYFARSTISRSGDFAKMWEMIDHKTAQVFEGKPYFTVKNLQEYDCKRSRRRMLAATAYSGHSGKGAVVGSEFFASPSPWEAVGPADGYAEHFLKLACGKK